MSSKESGDSTTADPLDGPSEVVSATRRRLGLVQIFPRSFDAPPARWPIRGRMTIGRRPLAEVRIDDARVSREHASIAPSGAQLRLHDCGSRHGTFVNGQPLRDEVTIGAGTIVRCGSTLLMVTDDCESFSAPQRLSREFLGLARDVWGGPALWRTWQRATQSARLPEPTLVLGESGSGKEVVARLIHAARSNPGPFVAINVAALQPGVFESELFGHVRGAFTGADKARAGAFRQASGGVLFLDEVGDLAMSLQVKLLRAIEQGSVRPLGADADVACNVRVVAATSRDLEDARGRGAFRDDLYYRLSGVVIRVPPLRERPDDAILLALLALGGDDPLELSVEAAELLALSPWPGNVRELQNAIVQARATLLEGGGLTLRPRHLPLPTCSTPAGREALSEQVVRNAMLLAKGNASRAAKALGISRATLYNHCDRLNLQLASVRTELTDERVSGVAEPN
jgi:transcriptional regulator of acetoin/glycerol metabolism